MWPCCDITSSDDDEHNTDSNFLLLFADVGITPTLLEGLSEIDVLHNALGCRFALDIFRISQQLSPTPDHEPLPHDPEFGTLSMGATHVLRLGGTCGHTVSTQDMLTSTAPVLPALSGYSLHPRHTRPSGLYAQCPTTQSWFAFHTAVSAHVPSHLGSSRSVFVHAGFILVYRGHTWR